MPNLSTILVGLVVFGTFGAILAGELRRHKAGRGGCSCGCGSCPGHGICHRGASQGGAAVDGTAHSETPGTVVRPAGE